MNDGDYDAKLTHLLDQAQAAISVAVSGHANLRSQMGGRPLSEGTRTGPVIGALVDKLVRELIGLLLTRGHLGCDHARPKKPGPFFWIPALEGVRCHPCFTDAVRSQVEGTDEDFRCDGCKKVGERLHPITFVLPPVIVAKPEAPMSALPAVSSVVHLCPACFERETAEYDMPEDRA